MGLPSAIPEEREAYQGHPVNRAFISALAASIIKIDETQTIGMSRNVHSVNNVVSYLVIMFVASKFLTDQVRSTLSAGLSFLY